MITDRGKLNWLRTQIRIAMFLLTGSSVVAFGIFVYRYSGQWGWKAYGVFVIGSMIGALIGTHHPANLFPSRGQESLRMTEEEGMAHLMFYWKRFPRWYCWLADLPYLIVLLILIALMHWKDSSSIFSLPALVGGLLSSAGLCSGVFFAYVLYTWEKE